MTEFHPFWWADILRTEKRIEKNAERGKIISDYHSNGYFRYEESAPVKIVVRMQKGRLPKVKSEQGWSDMGSDPKRFLAIASPEDALANDIGYDYWKKFYSRLQVIFSFIILSILGYWLGFGSAAGVFGGNSDYSFSVIDIISLAILAVAAILWIHFHLVNKRIYKKNPSPLNLKFTIPEDNYIFSAAEEKQMLKQKQIMTKTWPGWFYAPDKTKLKISRFAAEGWKFYRVDKMGITFYFMKDEPHNVSFVMDYQEELTDEYISNIQKDGWKLHFKSLANNKTFAMWSKHCPADEEPPEFYTDKDSEIRYATRMFRSITIPYSIVCLLYIALIIFFATEIPGNPDKATGLIFFIFFFVALVLEFGFFAFRTFKFWMRTKAKYM